MSDIRSKEEKAKEVYLKITSYAPYSEMNGISRDWFEKCIGNGLDEYAKQQSIWFAEWAAESGWEKFIEENLWSNRMGYVTQYTTDQLYNLFLDHKLKQQP